MDSAQIHAPSTPRLAWTVGGALLLGSVLVSTMTLTWHLAGFVIDQAIYAAALVVFAVGFRGSGSVTARRPLGTAALLVLAVWILLGAVLTFVLAMSLNPTPEINQISTVHLLGSFVLALVAVIQIARAGVVPAPWRWAPVWTLGAIAASGLVTQVVSAGASAMGISAPLMVAAGMNGLVNSGCALFLGVLAIVLGDRARRPQNISVAAVAV